MKDFNRVIQIDSINANAYFNRGCCYDSLGDLNLAISDYSVALELDLHSSNENANRHEDSRVLDTVETECNLKKTELEESQLNEKSSSKFKNQAPPCLALKLQASSRRPSSAASS